MQLSCVLFQVEIPAEPFSADSTCEGFSFVVCVHVERQVVDLMKGFIADGTFVGFLAAVR